MKNTGMYRGTFREGLRKAHDGDEAMTKPEIEPTIHLFRGSPCVRSWSKYQETDRRWTLCGRLTDADSRAAVAPGSITCRFCLDLMGDVVTIEPRPHVRRKARHSGATPCDHVPAQAALF
jgi:hypothetical protein